MLLAIMDNWSQWQCEGWERNELTDYIGPKNDLWPPSSQTLTFEDKSMKLSKVSIPIQFQICHQPNW